MPRVPTFSETDLQRMKNSYVLGDASLAQIAVEFGVSVPTVAKYLRRAGVEIRGRGRPRKKALVATDVEAAETTPTPNLENPFSI